MADIRALGLISGLVHVACIVLLRVQDANSHKGCLTTVRLYEQTSVMAATNLIFGDSPPVATPPSCAWQSLWLRPSVMPRWPLVSAAASPPTARLPTSVMKVGASRPRLIRLATARLRN